jgi:hypothetical protein
MNVNSVDGISAPDGLCTSTCLHVPQHRSKVKGLPGHSVSNKAATQPKGAGGTVGETRHSWLAVQPKLKASASFSRIDFSKRHMIGRFNEH